MLSADEEAQIRALTHLVTVLIQRISETDEARCRELLEAVKGQRTGPRTLDKAYDYTISIIERARGE